jgi:hypothetical protein
VARVNFENALDAAAFDHSLLQSRTDDHVLRGFDVKFRNRSEFVRRQRDCIGPGSER